MKALVYQGRGVKALEERPRPSLIAPDDAVVRITRTTICGTDLHILKGDVPTATEGRILGHEGIGVIEETGPGVTRFHAGDQVIVSCITSCGKCHYCRRGMCSHCEHGGWLLGNTIDGTQADYVRIPLADTSLHAVPPGADSEAMVLLSDVLPTGYECGVLNGCVKPGDTIAIVGAGPIGLAVLLTAQLYSPADIIMIDNDIHRLTTAEQLGASRTIDTNSSSAVEIVMEMTDGQGVDAAIEAVGLPETFELCQSLIAAGGHIANVGVHGKSVLLHLQTHWSRNITITTRLVDAATTPLLRSMIVSGRLQPQPLITHRFPLSEALHAYEVFGAAASNRALKVILNANTA